MVRSSHPAVAGFPDVWKGLESPPLPTSTGRPRARFLFFLSADKYWKVGNMEIFAIDPGNFKSAFCRIDAETLRPLEFDILPNNELRSLILDRHFQEDDQAVIERVASYGMAVGREVFETCEWVGRFEETLIRKLYTPPAKLYRIEEKKHICHSPRANDATIRRALIDRFAAYDLKNGRGTKAAPDWFYGFKADIWAAYAVGLTYIETVLVKEQE